MFEGTKPLFAIYIRFSIYWQVHGVVEITFLFADFWTIIRIFQKILTGISFALPKKLNFT